MPDSDRVSIWSISRPWGVIYYILFATQIAAVVCLITWQEIFHRTDDTAVDTILAIGERTAPNIITAAAVSLVIILLAEVTTMLAEPYLRRRFEAGRKEGREEERRKTERISAKIKAWNQRRLEHEANGEPFDEPLPDFDADDEDPQ